MREPVLVAAELRHREFRRQRWRRDQIHALTALAAALLLLPQAAPRAIPEISAVLAVASVALLAGHRQAIAIVALAEVLLVPSLLAAAPAGVLPPAISIAAAALALVGVRDLRRAAAAMLRLVGVARRPARCRFATGALSLAGLATALLAS